MAWRVVANGYGGPENLALQQVEMPEPGPGEVLIEVRAAGVNPADVKLLAGLFGADPARLPLTLGSEAAGVVTAVGPPVDGSPVAGPAGPISVGDEVIVYRVPGASASHLVVPAETVVPKPAQMSWAAASGLLLAGATALHALSVVAPAPGETLLVIGGTGAVGLTAVQCAVHEGVRVIATAAADRQGVVRDLGAEPVLAGPGLVERVRALTPQHVNAVIDTVGTDEVIEESVALVADLSRIATIAGFSAGARVGIRLLGGGPGAEPGVRVREAARLRLVEAVREGWLQVPVAAEFPLSRAADAYRAQSARHAPGKIVLVP